MVAPSGAVSRSVTLNTVNVLGGGTLSLQSDANGIFLNATNFKIHTGGKVDAVRLSLVGRNVEIAQSGLLDLSYKVCFLLIRNAVLLHITAVSRFC